MTTLDSRSMVDDIDERKNELRARVREARRTVDEPAARSIAIWSSVRAEPAVLSARTIMVFDSIVGEPDTASFIEWCTAVGKQVVVPDSDPSAEPPDDPQSIDVVIVPGVAFTAGGDRLGQGGGWYDRLLAELRDDCTTIGVCFDEQLVDEIPVDDHDRRVDVVISA